MGDGTPSGGQQMAREAIGSAERRTVLGAVEFSLWCFLSDLDPWVPSRVFQRCFEEMPTRIILKEGLAAVFLDRLEGEMWNGPGRRRPVLAWTRLQNFGFHVCKQMGREEKTPIPTSPMQLMAPRVQILWNIKFCKSCKDFKPSGRLGVASQSFHGVNIP